MKSLILIFLSCLWLFAGSVKEPTPIVIGDVYGFEQNGAAEDTNGSDRYYTFTMVEAGNIFIVNPDPKKPHKYRIYNEDFKLIESDIVNDSKAESLYRGKYLYHNLSGAFSIFSNKLK